MPQVGIVRVAMIKKNENIDKFNFADTFIKLFSSVIGYKN